MRDSVQMYMVSHANVWIALWILSIPVQSIAIAIAGLVLVWKSFLRVELSEGVLFSGAVALTAGIMLSFPDEFFGYILHKGYGDALIASSLPAYVVWFAMAHARGNRAASVACLAMLVWALVCAYLFGSSIVSMLGGLCIGAVLLCLSVYAVECTGAKVFVPEK